MAARQKPKFSESVFINCPFDPAYAALFRAIAFAIIDCGFTPRCALEISNSAQPRLHKILDLVEECKLGIHDLSRTELDGVNSLPRFNMPLELGLFLGCRRFGAQKQKTKTCLVFDREARRYQKFISDISGQDVESHDSDCRTAICRTRDWLRPQKSEHLPGGESISDRYDAFVSVLPEICSKLKLNPEALTFTDLIYVIKLSSIGE